MLAVFTASGFAGLVYEVVWMRLLTAVLGSTSAAIAAVLAAFMGGLALGSAAFGALVDRSRSPLRVFAGIELGIAATGLLVPVLLAGLAPLYAWLQPAAASPSSALAMLQFLLSLAVLMMPTALMGGTLPALTRAVVPPGRVARGVAALYAANTLGATAGAFSAGFILLPAIGMRATYVAAAINVLTAGAALLVARREGLTRRVAIGTASQPRAPLASLRPWLGRLVALTAAVSGFGALAAEVAWTRLLVFGLGSTTYAFATMLTTFLGGLALGSWGAMQAARAIRRPARALAVVQGLVGIVGVASLLAYTRYAERIATATHAAIDTSWIRATAIGFAAAAGALLPATLLMGATFPLACAAYAEGRGRLGGAVGRLYAMNTLGAIVGSLAAAFLLIPWWGIQETLVILAAGNLLMAAVLALAEGGRGALKLAAPAVLAALGLVLAPALRAPLHQPDIGGRLLFYREGRLSTVSVVENADGYKTLHIDKIAVAGTDPVMLTDQKSLAHLPMLLHPGATRALTVGFGSGGASWSFTRYSRLQQVDCAEIDPTVLEASSHFHESHHNVFGERKFELILDDARSFLQRTDRTYDIISTDCTDLRYKSNAMLYTREYFQLCRRRLNRGGLTVVWLPLGGLSTEDLRVAVATFRAVFPRMSVWYMNNAPAHYVLLIGADRDIPIDIQSLREQLAEKTVAEDLAEIGLADPWKIVSGFLFGAEGAARFAGGAPVNTDARPILEFSVPRGGFSGFVISRNLLSLLRERHVPPVRAASNADLLVLDRYWRAADRLIRGHALFQRGNHDYRSTVAQYRAAQAINPADDQTPRLIANVRATEASWRRVLERRLQEAPNDASARNRLGLVKLSEGDARGAAAEFEAAARVDPENWEAWFNQGLAHEGTGALDRAEAAYRTAVAKKPAAAMAYTNLGLLLVERGQLEAAVQALSRAAALDRESADAEYNLGVAYGRLGGTAEAEAAYRRALRLDPTHVGALANLGTILLVQGKQVQALEAFEQTLRADPTYAVAHYNRGLVLDRVGRDAEAESAYLRAVHFEPGYAEALNNLGLLNERRGQRKLAIEYFRRALAADPAYAEAHINLALALLSVGANEEARAHAERAVELRPDMGAAHAGLGYVLWHQGDRSGAVAALEKALAVDPTLEAVRQLLADVRHP